ncbi:MAG: hypothetical protein FWC45_04055, partial [Treponema sp.]|nr:hypothetical protein [Treponema sp.]
KVQADMKIVILDSCSSGAITRVKGGVKAQPFLFDSSVSAEGFAFLTSSSENETSQESDSIGSSYFTYSLLAGLRGAADSVGDGRVTLNELYRYAYAETLAKTETSAFGTQHPSYDIQISGSGDVVLTDIKEISSSLFFTEGLTGRISIRNGSDFLIAELTKAGGKPLEFGLEPGLYRIILQQGNNFYRAEIKLPEKRRATLDMKSFSTVVAFSGDRSRGNQGQGGDDSDADVPVYPVSLQLLPVPGFDLFGHHGWEQITNNFLFGLFAGRGCNIKGLGLSSLGLVNTGFVRGAQVSGLFNYTRLDVRGVQIAGLFNMASSLRGLQMGLVNINEGGCGCMAGLVNKSESENMFPLGLVNIIKNGIIHFGVYYDDMQFVNASFRSGSKYFYSFVSFGLGTNYSYSRLDTEKEGRNIPIGFRTGLGFECPVKNFFIDMDISGGCIFVTGNEDNGYENKLANYTVPSGQVRLIGGYKFFEQLGVFARLTYSIYRLPLIPDKKANDYYVKSGSYYSYKWGFVAGVQF